MRWSLVLLAACSSPPKQPSPQPIANTPPPPPPIDAPAPVEDKPELVAAGATLFEQRACKVCHDPSVTDKGGPLQGLWGKEVDLADGTKAVFDEAYVRESILEPAKKLRAGYPAVMPAYPIFTDDEMAQITAYIRSLR